MRYLYLLSFFLLANLLTAQDLYFPPAFGNWETQDPAELNWCEAELEDLHDFLEERDSKAFIVLKDGRMVIEWYYDTFTKDSIWYWASAGKSLTSTLVGIAQEEGLIDIENPTSDYLGTGWSSLSPEQEAGITVRHQLTMTTGLSDQTGDVDCTDPECLVYLAEPGSRWAYHNAPYTLLESVISNASGQSINQFFASRIGNTIGAVSAYLPLGYNRVVFSRPRDMARFGLLISANGQWNGTTVFGDQAYIDAMRTPSQDLNPSYGYLWWLNGQESYMYPTLQLSFPGPLIPTAPADTYAALGKNDQKIYIVPSQGLVIIRMGNDASDGPLAISDFDVSLWEKISNLSCTTSTEDIADRTYLEITPNPATDHLRLNTQAQIQQLKIANLQGQSWVLPVTSTLDVGNFPSGIYFLSVNFENGEGLVKKLVLK
ncbi:MAG: serine hydrolase [Lewinella sp.]|uniref:serine hydrolase n=1 Tax=Lewinella sp. TaxID=2004506 RepID=UPI003D6BB6F5